MKVDGSLGSLLQGVSQQTARDRLDGQCSLQENMSADPVKGLSKRAPTDLVGYLGSTSSIIGWHNFQTRDGNKFLAIFKTGDVDVFDLNAQAKTVTVDSNAVAYLSGNKSLRCATDDEDNTIVVNPSVNVAMTTSAIQYYNTEGTGAAIFQLLGGTYGRKYSIYIDGVLAAYYLTADGSVGADSAAVAGDYIATQLLDGLLNNTGVTSGGGKSSTEEKYGSGLCAGWTYNIAGDTFYIRKPSGTFNVTVTDGAGGRNFKAFTDTVTSISELPAIAPHYYAVRIAENVDQSKDLWFKFILNYLGDTPSGAGTFGQAGYWKEAVAPQVNTAFSAGTMPHKLVYNAPNFNFSREAYAPRGVGTEVSNPNPSFIGNTINDVTYFQGRAVFLSSANVVMSRTNKYTNFWQGSAAALAETDPIDVNSTVESSVLRAAVQHNKDLAVFSNKAQFVVSGRTGVTPQNAALALTTKFDTALTAHPVSAGQNIFFSYNFGRFSGLREYFAENTTEMNDSRTITDNVNKYIVGTTINMTGSANYEMLLVQTDTEQSTIYPYQYMWRDQQKVQSAWSQWKFKHDIVHSFFDEDVVYFVQRIGTDHYLLRMPLDVQDSTGINYPVQLDQRFDVLDCYQSFVLPFDYLADEDNIVCVQGTNCPTPGLTVGITSITYVDGTGYVVTLKKNMLGGDLVVGTRYMARYKPTMPAVKDQSGVVICTAKMRAKAFLISLENTGQITGQVRSKYGDGLPVSFNARIVGDIDNAVGEQPLSDDIFTMPFRYNVNEADLELYSDSHLPMTIADIEYVGQYNKRGQRIANSGGKQ